MCTSWEALTKPEWSSLWGQFHPGSKARMQTRLRVNECDCQQSTIRPKMVLLWILKKALFVSNTTYLSWSSFLSFGLYLNGVLFLRRRPVPGSHPDSQRSCVWSGLIQKLKLPLFSFCWDITVSGRWRALSFLVLPWSFITVLPIVEIKWAEWGVAKPIHSPTPLISDQHLFKQLV